MSKETQVAGAGFPLASILTICFVIAKLGGIVPWSWWWVVSPLWISALLTLGILGIVLIFAVLVAVIAALVD